MKDSNFGLSEAAMKTRQIGYSLKSLAHLFSKLEIATDSEIYDDEEIGKGFGYLLLGFSEELKTLAEFLDDQSINPPDKAKVVQKA